MKTRQRAMSLPIRIVDKAGRPVADATIVPWALRDATGHMLWRDGEQPPCDLNPQAAQTDLDGNANVVYPYYCDLKEEQSTTSVSISIDHPEYVRISDDSIKVPLEGGAPYRKKLKRGVQVEIRAFIDGMQTDSDNLNIYGTGDQWCVRGTDGHRNVDGALCISTVPRGVEAIWISRVIDDVATHFSEIVELPPGEERPIRIDVPLFPSRRVCGRLSNNVPRLIANGRVIALSYGFGRDIDWYRECAVQPDGTFVIDGWPQDLPMQVIALCDGFMAKPQESRRGADKCTRPQILDIRADGEVELEMIPLVRCAVTAADAQGNPIAGVHVMSFPNVQWFEAGASVYCGDDDDNPPRPFHGHTDENGHIALDLPAGTQFLSTAIDIRCLHSLVIVGNRLMSCRAKQTTRQFDFSQLELTRLANGTAWLDT